MSKRLRQVWEYLKHMGRESAPEFHRLGVQGSMELASALFNGHAFVPYGPGQWKGPEREGAGQEPEKPQEQEKQQERGGVEM